GSSSELTRLSALYILVCFVLIAYVFSIFFFFFFFQAEDGIRDLYVTGVQTCALPISSHRSRPEQDQFRICVWRPPAPQPRPRRRDRPRDGPVAPALPPPAAWRRDRRGAPISIAAGATRRREKRPR